MNEWTRKQQKKQIQLVKDIRLEHGKEWICFAWFQFDYFSICNSNFFLIYISASEAREDKKRREKRSHFALLPFLSSQPLPVNILIVAVLSVSQSVRPFGVVYLHFFGINQRQLSDENEDSRKRIFGNQRRRQVANY